MPAAAGAVAGGAGTLFLAAALVGGAFVYDMGGVWISVRGKKPGGENIRLVLPAAAAPVGIWLAPKRELREVVKEAGPYLPAIQAAAEELAHCPDGTLIEVINRHEKVHIAKKGSHLVIDVDDPNKTVHVAVPLEAVSVVASQFVSMAQEEVRRGGPSAAEAM